MKEIDVIIIGNGPGGISTALYTQRAKIDTLVIGNGYGALEKAHLIENYYGLEEPISGLELTKRGLKQAETLGVKLVEDEVVSISYEGDYVVKTLNETYRAKSVVLATGAARNKPPITNLDDYEGRGVSYCAVCDGFFYKDKVVGIVGSGQYALAEAEELLPLAKEVYLLTNGMPLEVSVPEQVKVIDKKIKSLAGEERLNELIFDDESTHNLDGLFIAIGTAGSGDFAKKLGLLLENNKIVVDAYQATNLPGLYAVGDCTPGPLQVAKAVGEGCVAGLEVVKYVRANK